MPPTPPPQPWTSDKPIGFDVNGKPVYPTTEFIQWLSSLIRSVKSAT